MRLHNFIILLVGFLPVCGFSQIGGRTAFNSLSLTDNARVVAQGGQNVSIVDDDVNRFMFNPAAITDSMKNKVSINYLPFVADIKKTSLTGVFDVKKLGAIGFGFQYVGYGEFSRTDEFGNDLGTFNASDWAFVFSKCHKLNNYSLGASLKFVGSSIDNYTAFAPLLDIGGLWKHPKRAFSIGMTFKNVGWVVDKYHSGVQVVPPLDVQFGASYKLEHMPLRLSITAHNLQVFDIVYLDPTRQTTFKEDGDKIPLEKTDFDKLFRHFVFGGEFVFSQGFHARLGYNVLRRRELRLEQLSGGAGFSFGFMMRVKSLEINFSRVFYHVSGGRTSLTITKNLNTGFRKKKSKKEQNNNEGN